MNSEPQALKTYQLGRMQRLPILRLVSIGAYLDGGIQDILLPLRYLPKDAKVGDEVEVFVYHDNEGRLIATTMRPLAQVGEVAFLRCASVSEAGAFMEWGIHRDLFVPFREQSSKMLLGYSYAVYLYVDQMSGKVVGSARLSKHLGGSPADYAPGSLVHCIVTEQHEEGYRCVIEGQHWGFVYTDAAPRMLRRGEQLEAYVVRVREDNKVDLSLRPVGYAKVDGAQERLLELLEQAGGYLPLGDKSPAEEILRRTGMSKKTFKMVLGALYKARRIELSPTSVRLSKEDKR
ncbi:CvfB family protein [Porphyromonas sp.]